ncbi:hypothetical protein CcaverHIS631_0306900 [Cutaneotrichosporon cavernicola]|nr:hypothetical protein CcaverHIS631_0306900 [Cutaneotrichosporon cavernicola]
MNLSALISLLGLFSAAAAAPITPRTTLPRLGGLNLAGCDFGMNVWGWSGTSMCPPISQIGHFIEQGSNVIRLPVGWQYLVGNNPASTTLDATYFPIYDRLVQDVTSRGAYAIIDIHNYGRWNSGIIGADGPSNMAFASLWSLLAKKYADNDHVIFGLMNEPHDQDIIGVAAACQAAVNAIRSAGARNTIILPGNQWTKAETWTSGANNPILAITDPTGGLDRLLLDVHKYLDADGSDVLAPFVGWLKTNGRRAIITEMGGANTQSCQTYIPKMLQYVVDNNDVFVGFTAWAAGSFQPYPGYELSLTPNADGSDNALWTKAIKPFLPGKSGVVSSTTTSISKPVSSSSVVASLSSSKPVPTSSSPSVKPARSSSSAPSAASSSTAASTSKPVTPSSAASSSASVPAWSSQPKPSVLAGNYQTFTGALGGFSAPAVTKAGNKYYTNGQEFNSLIDALDRSCYTQMDRCQLSANVNGNVPPLTVANCSNAQFQACMAAAK